MEEMQCAECGNKLRSDVIKCFKKIDSKIQRVCTSCFEKPREKLNKKLSTRQVKASVLY